MQIRKLKHINRMIYAVKLISHNIWRILLFMHNPIIINKDEIFMTDKACYKCKQNWNSNLGLTRLTRF